MIKKIVCLMLSFVAIISLCSMPEAKAANESVKTQLIKIYNRFPHGKYWNHVGVKDWDSDTVTSSPCPGHYSCSWRRACSCNRFENAIQCMGYAHKIAYEIVGVSPKEFTKSYKLDASKLRVGDIIRYKSDTHSLTVTGIKGTKISFTDANWIGKCQIRWSQMDLSEIMRFSYVLHYKYNDRKNTDLDFYEDAPQPDNTEKWINSSENSLNIRNAHTVDSKILTSIPAGDEFYIYRHYDDGKYLWGKVQYGAYKGWCALNWSKYVSKNGKCAEPSFVSNKESYYYKDAALRWSSVSGADKYVLRVLDSDGELAARYVTENLKQTLDIKKTGKYTAKVYARSSHNSTWAPVSKEISFTLTKSKPVYVTDIEMKNTLSLSVGSSKTLKATVVPENASDKTLIWKSSDESVATVSSKGKITAKGCGYAVITCKADDKKGYSEVSEITVKPDKADNLKATDKKKDTKISFKWSKAKGATYYEIYKYDGKEYTLAAKTKKTEYTEKELKKNKNYYFKIVSVYKKDNLKIKSGYSDRLKVTA